MNAVEKPAQPGIKNSLDKLAMIVGTLENEVKLITERTAAFRVPVPPFLKAGTADPAPKAVTSEIEDIIDNLATRVYDARTVLTGVTDGIRV